MTEFSALLACAPNFREVSGLRARDGRVVAGGRLFRSDAVLAPEATDREVLAGIGIDLVFDLRSATERAVATNAFLASTGADLRPVDLLARIENGHDYWHVIKAQPDAQGGEAAMHAVYGAFPAALHSQLLSMVEAIAVSPGAVLVHCTAGKDRTGFVIAVLLGMLGASKQDIAQDYLLSAGRGNAQVRERTRLLAVDRIGFDLPAEVIDRLMSVRESYLDAAMARIQQDFGGLDSYLASAGVTAQHIAALEGRLLA